MTPTIDVVICTYNNAPMLDEVLTALGRQQPVERGRWSCLVVNNNCTDDTDMIVQKHHDLDLIPGLRAIRETEQGLTPARLRGVRSTTAPWVAFVDDDCVPQSEWIVEAIAFADNHPDAGAFGGKVIVDFVSEPANYVRACGYAFAEQNRGEFTQRVPFLVGAGLVASRAALSACGWTDAPVLEDRVGQRLVSGGDVEIVLRIGSAGYGLWYVPSCEIRHRIPSRRTSLRYLVAINCGLGVSQSLADALVWDGTDGAWAAASVRQVLKTVRSFVGVVISAARGRSAAAEICIQASMGVGQVVGISRVLRMSPSHRRMLMGLARPARRPFSKPTNVA